MSLLKAAHIGLNAHLLSGRPGYRRAGIHHYIAGLIDHLPASPEWRFTVFTRATLNGAAVRRRATRWPTERPMARIVWEQLAWPLAALGGRIDLLHSLAFVTPLLAPCPTVVTVFDLSFMHYPQQFPPTQRLYLTSQTRRSVQNATRVVAISESGRADLNRLLGVPLPKIDVVPPGVDGRFRPREAETIAAFRRRAGLDAPFILHVGTLQPRKNLPLLIDAFAQLVEQPDTPADIQLVLVGGKGWLYDEIFARVKERRVEDRVRFTGYVADTDLPLWYNAADMVVFPSLYEGFGLPVAQAMASGTPVVAADVAAIPEAAGEAALLFDPLDSAALANRMANVLADAALAATLRQRGLRRAQAFSWNESARRLVEVYRRALA